MIRLTINGAPYVVDPVGPESLLITLRDRLGLFGSKNACEQGECGSCSVLLDGHLVCSCLVMAADADGSQVTTVEGIAEAGYRTVINCNAAAGQTIYHLHLHLLGGRPMQWPPG